MAIFKSKNKSIDTTLPKSKTVHGIEIKKVPIGQYLTAMSGLEDLPSQVLADLFPGKEPADILKELTKLTNDGLSSIIARAVIVIPKHLITLLAPILGVAEEELLALSPAELMDVVKEFKDINDLSRFFGGVSGLIKTLLPTLTKTTGSSNGLR